MKILALGILMAAMVAGQSTASAKTGTEPLGTTSALSMRALAPAAHAQLADNVVVTPGSGAPPTTQAAPAQPAAAASSSSSGTPAVAPAPSQTVVEPGPRKVVHAEVQSSHNYMTTIAVSALMGALAGGLVGGAVYYLGDREHAVNIAYWAAGGVILGTGVGVLQLVVQENRVSEATALRKLPSDPAPTLRLALLRTHF
jgi:hypothetical protein